MAEHKKTIVFDFDGVIHSYSSGWKGHTIIPDPPVEGIKEIIKELRKNYKVVVVSSRCKYDGGIPAIKMYLRDNDIIVDDVTADKVPALCYVDDRAVYFDGNNPYKLLEDIKNFKTWRENNG